MNTITKQTETHTVSIVAEEEVVWTELLLDFILCLKGMGYYSDDFDKLLEEYGMA